MKGFFLFFMSANLLFLICACISFVLNGVTDGGFKTMETMAD